MGRNPTSAYSRLRGSERLLGLIRRLREPRDEPSRAAPNPELSDVRVLVVTRDALEWRLLNGIAETAGWILFWAHGSRRAAELICEYGIRVVVWDRDLPHEDWRQALPRLGELRRPVRVLLATPVADEYLWREVVQNRGFDLITKPFQPDQVVRAVRLVVLSQASA